MTLKYRSLVICNLPIIVVETTVTFIESSSKLSRCGLLNNTLAWHYVIIYSKAIAPASVWIRELVWWLICTSISISMANWDVQLGQGCHRRQDCQDRGLNWILQNRMQRQQQLSQWCGHHCGHLAFQKPDMASGLVKYWSMTRQIPLSQISGALDFALPPS